MQLNDIKTYIEIAGLIIFAVTSVIFLFKLIFRKVDKNGNGRIEKEEIEKEDLQFIKDMLKESFITIATGLKNIHGIEGNQAYKLLNQELKNNYKIFEKEIDKNENEKKC